MLLIDSGRSAEDRRLLGFSSVGTADFWRQLWPAGGRRTMCYMCSLFFCSYAHPSPWPQLPETEGLCLLFHRWDPTTFLSSPAHFHLCFPCVFRLSSPKHTNMLRNKDINRDRQKVDNVFWREAFLPRAVFTERFWWQRCFPDWWLNASLTAITVIFYPSLCEWHAVVKPYKRCT